MSAAHLAVKQYCRHIYGSPLFLSVLFLSRFKLKNFQLWKHEVHFVAVLELSILSHDLPHHMEFAILTFP